MCTNKWRIVLVLLIGVGFAMALNPSPAEACQCLTRTPGFWGTHPDITAEFISFDDKDYLPVCGKKLTEVDATACSAVQAMCVATGVESREEGVQPQLLSLIRALAAARLNLRATWSVGGGCMQENTDMVADCDHVCEFIADGTAPFDLTAVTDCIGQLDAFNNMTDTMDPFGPFIKPGAGDPSVCQASTGDTIQILDCTVND